MKLFDKILFSTVVILVIICFSTWEDYTNKFKAAQREHPIEQPIVAKPIPLFVAPSWEPVAPTTTPKTIIVIVPKPTKIPETVCYHFLDGVQHCESH